ncbi:MAG TPA: hypothetical protein VK603_20620 [Candidatus Saccharimonadales bacterium]|nr:hypothetical protein [Candidatus Saccharimonadales bacterium]
MKPPLLQVNNLTVKFRLRRGTLSGVDRLSQSPRRNPGYRVGGMGSKKLTDVAEQFVLFFIALEIVGRFSAESL